MPDRSPISRRRFLKRVVGGAAVLTLGNLAVDAGWLDLTRTQVKLPNWRGGKVRIGFLTDPHLNSDRALGTALDALDLIRGEKPDVLLLGGDYLNYFQPRQTHRLTAFAERARSLGVPMATVMGNHDYGCAQVPEISRVFEHHGIHVLRNRGLDLDGLQIFGYDDGLLGQFDPHALSARQFSHSTIALLHEPDFVRDVPRHLSLQLSGHSHGGQMCLPFGLPAHTPLGARDYTAGFYEKAPVPLYVSRGTGTTGPPVRLFCRPEATILDIEA